MQSKNGHKRAVLYTRVSTDEQAEKGYSLPSQLNACRTYASEHGYIVPGKAYEIVDDCSGAKLDRPGLDQVRGLIDRREVEAVIIYTSDRLSRNLAHSLLLREEWQRAGIELHYVSRGKSEDTPEGRMMENIEAVIAEYEREKIKERTRRGKLQKAMSGKWVGNGSPPYGYRRDDKGNLAIDELEAEIVRRIFALYIGTDDKPIPLKTLAVRLTSEGVPSPKRGRGWYKSTIKTILDNPAYTGRFRSMGHLIDMPDLALIDRTAFKAAQTRRAKNRALASRNRKREYLLSGLIRCSCHRTMCGNAYGEYSYYVCGAQSDTKHITTCRETKVPSQVVDTVVWRWLYHLLKDDAALNEGLEGMAAQRETEIEPKRKRLSILSDLIAKEDRRIKRLASTVSSLEDDADEESETALDALKAELRAAGKQRSALIAERERIMIEISQREISAEARETIRATVAKIRNMLDNTNYEDKRYLFDALDVQAQVEYRDGQRGIYATCGISCGGEWLQIESNDSRVTLPTALFSDRDWRLENRD